MTEQELFKIKAQKAVLEDVAKDNGLVKYEYPDGFYCFGNPDCQELADKKHEEWLEKQKLL